MHCKCFRSWMPRQQSHLPYVAEFTADIRQVADALPCPPTAAVAPTPGEQLDYAAMADQQPTCHATQEQPAPSSLLVVRLDFNIANLLCDVFMNIARPLMSAMWQWHVLTTVHNLAHSGKRASGWLVSRFMWKGCVPTVNRLCEECTDCAHVKPGGTPSMPVESIPIPYLDIRVG
jgi:hypothetical protein